MSDEQELYPATNGDWHNKGGGPCCRQSSSCRVDYGEECC